VAKVLNTLFQTDITGWDVDFCVGRNPVRLDKLSQKILLGECWHTPGGTFREMTHALAGLFTPEQKEGPFGCWMEIALRIAVLFGIYGELSRNGMASADHPFDVSVVSGDFSAPISAWYARKWGLPVGNIVCCCNENGNLWNLVSHGQLRTDGVAVCTDTTEADVVVPEQLERLVSAVCGEDVVEHYLNCVRTGSTWYLDEPYLSAFRQGLYVTVVGSHRMHDTIVSFFGTNRAVLSPYGALACAGLQDYRSRTGESRWGLVLSERSPRCDAEVVAKALGILPERLRKYV
jgi:threonine synthase